MRVVHDDASGSGRELTAPRQDRIKICPEPYTPERFFADLGVMLILLLALALVLHIAFMIAGS